MTERTPLGMPAPGSTGVVPPEQTIDGIVVAPEGLIAQPSDATVEAGLEFRVRSQWDYARRRFLRHRFAVGGLVLLILIFAAGIFANQVVPYDPNALDLLHIYQAPTSVGHHWFGTDEIGRDYLSRTIFGI